MDEIYGKLTVFFDEPFWIGIFETIYKNQLSVCKVVFGAEPKDNEVYEFILKNYCHLDFSPSVSAEINKKKLNPKKRFRAAKTELSQQGIGTKSQQALKLLHEKGKQSRKLLHKEKKLEAAKQKFSLKQQKKKEKRKGH